MRATRVGRGADTSTDSGLFAPSFACRVTDWSPLDHVTGREPNHARDNEIAYVNVCPQREHKTNADAVAIWVVLFMRQAETEMSPARLGTFGSEPGGLRYRFLRAGHVPSGMLDLKPILKQL